ncbi:MAG TPA: PilN domain-containing protein [Burkholderiales bacterium]|nr:PilN domain-containing protein [Burkholderiales bacterium]
MIRINLLPHREMRRQRQQKQFFVALGAVVAAGVVTWLLVHTSLAATHEDRMARNKYLEDEIAKLDKEIADIKKLKEMMASLLARKKVVETLQANRSDVVHLMDELARQLPEGIYLKQVKQAASRVTINGYTQSQARVSTLMRNLEASPHLENANLVEIKSVTQPIRINEFTLNVSLERPKEEPEKGKPAPKRAAAK